MEVFKLSNRAPVEADILRSARALLDFLKAHRLLTYRRIHVAPIMRGGGADPIRFQQNKDMAGFTDLIIGVKATQRIILAEAKREGGKLSSNQEEFHRDWRQMGFTVCTFRSITELEDILESNGVQLPYERKKPCHPGNTSVENAKENLSTAPKTTISPGKIAK
jgi:hypothetical protein